MNQLRAATGDADKTPKQMVVNDINDLQRLLSFKTKQIGSVIASNLTPEKMCRIAMNELRQNSYLANIAVKNPGSFVNAILQASHLGLEIGGALGQAYLVPYKDEIKMIPGYRGLISLSRRSGDITSINAEVVYENDKFELELGIDPKMKHVPELNGDRGLPKLVYMVAKFKDGGYHFEWMSMQDVEKVRAASSSDTKKTTSPWVKWYEEMAKKTVVRRGWKYLPMSIEMESALTIETANDENRSVVFDNDTGSIVVDDGEGAVDQKPDDKPAIENNPSETLPATNIDMETGEVRKQPVQRQQQAADDQDNPYADIPNNPPARQGRARRSVDVD
jgi:recombination protein RecT